MFLKKVKFNPRPHPTLLAFALSQPHLYLMPWEFAERYEKMTEAERVHLHALQQRLDEGEPLSKIVGKREFYSRDFKVTYDTLDPRPDSEILIDAGLEILKAKTTVQPLRILELGVGTGCLILTLILEMQQMGHEITGIGVDCCEKALAVAEENAEKHQIFEKTCTFILSDWFQSVPAEKFDLILTNPPYIGENEIIDASVRQFDPKVALFAEEQGLKEYKRIAKDAMLFLMNDGILACEIGYRQKKSVTRIFTDAGYVLKQMHKDLAGRDRCLVFQPTFINSQI